MGSQFGCFNRSCGVLAGDPEGPDAWFFGTRFRNTYQSSSTEASMLQQAIWTLWGNAIQLSLQLGSHSPSLGGVQFVDLKGQELDRPFRTTSTTQVGPPTIDYDHYHDYDSD